MNESTHYVLGHSTDAARRLRIQDAHFGDASERLLDEVALRSRDRGGPALALQVLVYPVTDHDLATASYIERDGEDALLSRRSMKWFWDQYIPDPAVRTNPEASPLRAPDLSDLPAAVVVTAEYDPLRDEGRAYAQRLRDAGVAVTSDHYQDMAHPFFAFVNVFERSNEAVERVAERIRAAVTSAAPATGLPRRIVNPHQGDTATFLQTSKEKRRGAHAARA